MDKNQQTATAWRVRAAPTLLLLKNGAVHATHVGMAPKALLLVDVLVHNDTRRYVAQAAPNTHGATGPRAACSSARRLGCQAQRRRKSHRHRA